MPHIEGHGRRQIEWHYAPNGGALGRNIDHDPRSRAFAHKASGRALVSVKHTRRIPILNQGDLGSCTGNAATGALGTDPVFRGLQPADGPLVEAFAVGIYSDATKVDEYAGTYPPTDTGSSGLAVGKVCKARGYISGYRHAFSVDDALDALQDGPVLTGVSWHTGMDSPTETGLVSIAGAVRGGHEFVADSYDADLKLVGFSNSWGDQWGAAGRFYMHADDWGTLLDDHGDVTVFVPNGQPAPTADPDVVLWQQIAAWARSRHIYPPVKTAAAELLEWAKAKGYS